jgi:hypothetical protein
MGNVVRSLMAPNNSETLGVTAYPIRVSLKLVRAAQWLGIATAPGVLWLAYEAIWLRWSNGPQMLLFSAAHGDGLPIFLVLFALLGAVLLTITAVALWIPLVRRRFRGAVPITALAASLIAFSLASDLAQRWEGHVIVILPAAALLAFFASLYLTWRNVTLSS